MAGGLFSAGADCPPTKEVFPAARSTGLCKKPRAGLSAIERLSWASNSSTSARRARSPPQAASRYASRSVPVRSAAPSNTASTRSVGSSVIAPPLAAGRRRRAQLPRQPGLGEAPLALEGADRPADDVGGLFKGHPGVIAEHHD